MNRDRAQKLAIDLMTKHGVYPTFHFRFINRKSSVCGWCSYDDGNHMISLNSHFVEGAKVSEVKDIILHEIAHALDYYVRGFSNHDSFWKEIFIRLGGSGEIYVYE
jgi:predicted SprT family Zn-dependent metalloprotease